MIDAKKLLEGKSINLITYQEPYKGNYYSVVENVTETTFSIIAPNNSEGTTLLLPKGMKVSIVFWDDIRAYMLETRIEGRSNFPVPVFILRIPDNLIEIQRRNFVRVSTHIPLKFKILMPDEESEWFSGTTVDISGGGLKFSTTEIVEKEAALCIQITLPTLKLETLVRVCRIEKNIKTDKNEVGVEFFKLSEKQRDHIIRYVFDLQRALRKKGLI